MSLICCFYECFLNWLILVKDKIGLKWLNLRLGIKISNICIDDLQNKRKNEKIRSAFFQI